MTKQALVEVGYGSNINLLSVRLFQLLTKQALVEVGYSSNIYLLNVRLFQLLKIETRFLKPKK